MEKIPEQLVRRARKGEKEAFTALIYQCEPLLFRTAMSIVKNTEDAADAIQDAILEAYRNLGKLRSTKYFRTWLVRILINQCYELCRQRQKHLHGDLEAVELAVEESDRDTALDVSAVLGKMAEQDRLLLGYYYSDGLSVREIAQVLDIQENAVKQRLYRSRKHFQEIYMEGEGFCHEG